MMTPSEYADRYRNLTVGFTDGDVTVTIQRYHLGGPDDEKDRLVQAVKEHIRAELKRDPDFKLSLIVNEDTSTATYKEVAPHLVGPFTGKGSPEDCQIAAQLAVLTKRTSKENLRRYCDDHLGLDCSGFVGNYFFRVRNPDGQNWKSFAVEGADLGPDSLMNEFIAAGQPVTSVDRINPANIHLFVEVNDHLHVIKGGKQGVGHIVITEPNKYTPTSFVINSFGGLDLGYAQKGAYGHPALWAVEATGPQGAIGLKESWYAIKRSVATKHTVNRGIYEVFRGSKAENLNFEMVAFAPSPIVV
jgi:hypothetical protein